MEISDYTVFSEQSLLIKLKQRDALAFQEIYGRTWKVLYTAAFKRLRNRETCQDVVHDVYADLWNKCDTKEIDNLLPYLHTAVKYKIFTLLAKGVQNDCFVEPFETMAFSDMDADTFLRSKELEDLVMHWIKALPKKRRTIFHMKFIDDLTTGEISRQLSISQKTVQNQVSTTFNELRFHISQYLFIILIVNALQ